MSEVALDRAAREVGGRIRAALAARFRDLDLAEEGFAEACARAAAVWPQSGAPRDPAAWLYCTATRAALDMLRRRRVRARLTSEPLVEQIMPEEHEVIPDERLRLIFVCCHPAVAPEARAALTLRLVCGLASAEIARAFLLPEPTLAQRIVRAKRKIAEAGVPFEIPGPEAWPERLEAVLTTIEIAYVQAHADAAKAGPHAGYAEEALELTRVLAELLPDEPEVLALAATVRFAEARRPARIDEDGVMIPLTGQDPARWRRPLILEGRNLLRRALNLAPAGPRVLQAGLHEAWCARASLAEPPPWPRILALYDAMLGCRDDALVRLNRAVAVAEVMGVTAALAEIERLDPKPLANFLPYHAARADLLRRAGCLTEARAAYGAAIALGPGPAERLWLERQRRNVECS